MSGGKPVPTNTTLTRARKAALKAHGAVADRNQALAEALADGHTLRQLADATGLSHTAVSNIARKVAADAKRQRDRERRAAKRQATTE